MTNINIKVVSAEDISDPQVLAMLQAFYSRSPMPIEERLAGLEDDAEGTKTDKVRNAIKRYYVDYGHASIGECGGATVFVEGISMLAAKAIQDHPLYVGQECSTRYIDFGTQPFFSASPIGDRFLEAWRAMYKIVYPFAVSYAASKFKAEDVVSSKIPTAGVEAAYERTCKAIAFDYCRGLLPAGATTAVAWTANFRVFNDHLRFLVDHPLKEVRELAIRLYSELSERFPSSFRKERLKPKDEAPPIELYYWDTKYEVGVDNTGHIHNFWIPDPELLQESLKYAYGERDTRHCFDNEAYFEIRGDLDFGSYRDLQRHRRGMNRMPLLVADRGFNSYYFKALSDIHPTVMAEAGEIVKAITELSFVSEIDKQYLLPMGMNVPTRLHWSLGQLQYVMRLRTLTTVHPTLRKYMLEILDSVDKLSQSYTHIASASRVLKYNVQPDYFSSDRGEQTIKERA